ncbi:AAA domain-containing protein [Calditrichota bacterium GD2]
MEIVSNIIRGIESEIENTPEYVDYKIVTRKKDDDIWILEVDQSRSIEPLIESFEGSKVWWGEPQKGTAELLSVIPENNEMHLRFATSIPPEKSQLIRIYPSNYLDNLLSIWSNDPPINTKEQLYDLFKEEHLDVKIPNKNYFPLLRKMQKAAFDLLKYHVGFLWGPPGTGKTFTLGILLSSFLVENPESKILLLSTTNTAVDLALISLDDALEELSGVVNSASLIRERCKRVGNHFHAYHYKSKQHLLPARNDNLLKELLRLEEQKPDKENAKAYSEWKRKKEEVQLLLKRNAFEVIYQSNLAAMTITRALSLYYDLIEQKFDLIVFDESSQVSILHALPLTKLSKQIIFVGDKEQISPIVKSKHPYSLEWLGKSSFNFVNLGHKENNVCFLDEQSRMHTEICNIVSCLFYRSRLKVAEDKFNDSNWAFERDVVPLAKNSKKHVEILMVPNKSNYSKKYGGLIRYDSAQMIIEIVKKLKRAGCETSDLLILTPYRAQKNMIKKFLKISQLKKIKVSTVHSAQGSEHKIIIFDPVDGTNDFLNPKKNKDANQIINVALSRAKAQLILLFSEKDLTHEKFKQIKNIISNQNKNQQKFPNVRDFINQEFPFNLKDKEVVYAKYQGKVIHISEDGSEFVLFDYLSGKKRKFKTQFIS